jgi:hypothetical protein
MYPVMDMYNICTVFILTSVIVGYTMIKKKIEFSSYIRNFRRDRVQSHTCLTASSYMTKYLRTSSYIRKPFLYDFAPVPF